MAQNVSAKFVLTNPIHCLSFGFGSGLLPKAPGTFGTLAAIPLYYLVADLSLSVYAFICVVICLLGIYFCEYTSKALKAHDHPGIVWDEIAGFFITMIGFSMNWQNLVLGFILFRFFDIIKPWPIRWIDSKVTGGFGIMLDDIIAGGFAWCSLHGIYFLWQQFA
ncbi:phosphatidylglycerophosphatase A family protein [Aliikangiella sp. IMCC44359]|uniref:phosphatidylglycerophosphatase A family protein n=1 Tax=Aliikangiella sp. IMCC44359 TaxID=3459125 RepID=UPI00403B2DD5